MLKPSDFDRITLRYLETVSGRRGAAAVRAWTHYPEVVQKDGKPKVVWRERKTNESQQDRMARWKAQAHQWWDDYGSTNAAPTRAKPLTERDLLRKSSWVASSGTRRGKAVIAEPSPAASPTQKF